MMASKRERPRIVGIGLFALGAYFVWHYFSAAVFPICSETVEATVLSPDRSLAATVYRRSCNDGARIVAHVNVRKSNVSYAAESSGVIDQGQVYSSEGASETRVVWIDARTIRVEAYALSNAPGFVSKMQSATVLSVGDP
jgi:hypothetical protein